MKHDLIKKKFAIRWLEEAANWFEQRSSEGEDINFWTNQMNATSCRRIQQLIREMVPDEVTQEQEN